MEGMYEIYVTHFESPTKFFIVMSEKVPLLDSIWQEIDKELSVPPSAATSSANRRAPFEFLNTFSPCIALWQDRWYRARVLFRRPDGKLEVEFIDYGNTAAVDPDEVRKRPTNPLISNTEKLALACRLSGDASYMNKKRFEEACVKTGGRFRMKVDDVDDESGLRVVTLYMPTDRGNMRSVNEFVTDIRPMARSLGLSDIGINLETPPKRPTAIVTTHQWMGPMGGRLRRPTEQTGAVASAITNTVPNNIGKKKTDPCSAANTLVDLSEEPTKTSACGENNYRASQYCSVADIDAILDGPIEDLTDDEEEVDCTKKGRGSEKRKSVNRNRESSVSSGSCSGMMDDLLAASASRGIWSHALSLRYGTVKTPAPGTMSAEQSVIVTRISSPSDFYAQTINQRDGLRRLELPMADEFHPDQMPIPVNLIMPDICCAVYNDVAKTWRRGRVLRVNQSTNQREQMTVDVRLVDTGFERSFPPSGVKPMTDRFTTYLPLVFNVKLANLQFEHIIWKQEDVDAFRRMIEGRTLLMKFVGESSPVPEVEIIDLTHTCQRCSCREKRCTINERLIRWIQENGGLASRI